MENNFINAYISIIKEDQEQNVNTLDELIQKYDSIEKPSKEDITALLNIAVCDELLASFNYLISYNISVTEGKKDFDEEFQQHEKEEKDHADKLIRRLREMDCPVLRVKWADYLTQNSNGTAWTQETSEISMEIIKHRYDEELGAIKFYDCVLRCVKKIETSEEWASSVEHLIKEIKNDEEKHELDLRDLMKEHGVELNKSEVQPETEENKEGEEDNA